MMELREVVQTPMLQFPWEKLFALDRNNENYVDIHLLVCCSGVGGGTSPKTPISNPLARRPTQEMGL
jgi:hypothetical protein